MPSSSRSERRPTGTADDGADLVRDLVASLISSGKDIVAIQTDLKELRKQLDLAQRQLSAIQGDLSPVTAYTARRNAIDDARGSAWLRVVAAVTEGLRSHTGTSILSAAFGGLATGLASHAPQVAAALRAALE